MLSQHQRLLQEPSPWFSGCPSPGCAAPRVSPRASSQLEHESYKAAQHRGAAGGGCAAQGMATRSWEQNRTRLFLIFFRFCSPWDAPNEWEPGLWVAKSAAVAAAGPASLEDGCFARGSLAVPGRWRLLRDRSVQRGFVLAGTRQAPPGWRNRARRSCWGQPRSTEGCQPLPTTAPGTPRVPPSLTSSSYLLQLAVDVLHDQVDGHRVPTP